MIEGKRRVSDMLEEWHSATDGPRCLTPPREIALLRWTLIDEESYEVESELVERYDKLNGARGRDYVDRAKLAKELADLVYVAYGTAREYNIPLHMVVEGVHDSNMTKIEGGIQRREDGKILKGPNYKEVDVQAILNAYDKKERLAYG